MASATATLPDSGHYSLVMFGGYLADGFSGNQLIVFDTVTLDWHLLLPGPNGVVPSARGNAAAAFIGSGSKFVVTGGDTISSQVGGGDLVINDDLYYYDFGLGSWIVVETSFASDVVAKRFGSAIAAMGATLYLFQGLGLVDGVISGLDRTITVVLGCNKGNYSSDFLTLPVCCLRKVLS